MIKALKETKPNTLKPETKPKTTPKQTLKPETPKRTPETKPKKTPKQTLKPEKSNLIERKKHTFFNKDEISEYRKAFHNTKKYKLFESEIEETRKNLNKLIKILKPETKLEVKFNRKKLEKLEKDFGELRHKLSNKDEISEYRKTFYNAKKHKLFESEIEKTNKNLNKLIKSLKSKKFQENIDSVDYEDLDSYNNNYDFADDDKLRKIGSIRTLFREFDSDYYTPIRTHDDFTGKKIIILNIRAKEIDMKIYHLKNILM